MNRFEELHILYFRDYVIHQGSKYQGVNGYSGVSEGNWRDSSLPEENNEG